MIQKIQAFALLAMITVLATVFFKPAEVVKAQSSRYSTLGARGLVLCSQNLYRLGDRGKKRKQGDNQQRYLINRMKDANCDVVAVQELFGHSRKEAERNLAVFTAALSKRTGRPFRGLASSSNDQYIRNGFIYDSDAVKVLESKSLASTRLQRMLPAEKRAFFSRGPLALLVEVKDNRSLTPGVPRELLLITFHLKSKSDGWKDRSGTSFESLRMVQAQGLREEAFRLRETLAKDATLLLLGDRNTEETGAAAEVLSGALELGDFSKRICRLEDSGRARCNSRREKKKELVPLLEEKQRILGINSSRKKKGSYYYKKRESLIDEIFVDRNNFKHLTRKSGLPHAGFEGEFFRGSDHKLLWAVYGGGV